MLETVLIVAGVVLLVGLLGVGLAPTRVGYSERVTVDAPADRVFAHIACQQDLMAWSAWPAATGMSCRVEGADARVGARLVYLKNGRPMGDQTVTELVPGERVVLALSDPTPFGQVPVVAFDVTARGPDRSEVVLSFTNRFRRPFNLLVAVLRIPRWVQALHRKDLHGLKAFCEGQPAAA